MPSTEVVDAENVDSALEKERALAQSRSRPIEENLHHIWIGSGVTEKEQGYVNIWKKAYPEYASHFWVDPYALMVAQTKKAIGQWAEKKALAHFRLNDRKAFDRFTKVGPGASASETDRVESNVSKYLATVLRYSNQKRYELDATLRSVAVAQRDDERIKFIVALQQRAVGPDAAHALELALNIELAAQRQAVSTAGADGGVDMRHDLRAFFREHGLTAIEAAYDRELDLRQNMAAAADIARLAILNELGGVYVDLDLLPAMGPLIQDIQKALDKHPITKKAIFTNLQIADAVVAHLGLIPGYTYAPDLGPAGNLADANLDPAQRERIERWNTQQSVFKQIVAQIMLEPANDLSRRVPRLNQTAPPYGGFSIAFNDHMMLNGFMKANVHSPILLIALMKIQLQHAAMAEPALEKALKAFDLAKSVPDWKTAFRAFKAALKGTPFAAMMSESFFQNLLSYMADGVRPRSQATVDMLGPNFLRVIAREFMQKEYPVTAERGGLSGDDAWSEMVSFWSWFQTEGYRDSSVDARQSSWIIFADNEHYISEVGLRYFPAAITPPRDGTLAIAAEALWRRPVLRTDEEADEVEPSSNYDGQLIVQFDGDDTAGHAAQALYNKHPRRSAFVQIDHGRARYIDPEADAFTYGDARRARDADILGKSKVLRITFVGHGDNADGVTTFGGKSSGAFFNDLGQLIRQQRVGAQASRLVLNLVGCNLDDLGRAQLDTFVGGLVRDLPEALGAFGVSPEIVEVHAREGEVKVTPEGRKNSLKSTYRFREGRYVREMAYGSSTSAGHFTSLNLQPGGPPSADTQGAGVVLLLDDGDSARAAAADLFNAAARKNILVEGVAEGEHTIFVDSEGTSLALREGLSRLAEFKAVDHVTVVGQLGASGHGPTVFGQPAADIVSRLTPILQRVVPGTSTFTLSLIGAGVADRLSAESELFRAQLGHGLLAVMQGRGATPGKGGTDWARLSAFDLVFEEGHFGETSSGSRHYVTSHGTALSGPLAELYAGLHTTTLHYDPVSARFDQSRVSAEQLTQWHVAFAALQADGQLDAQEQAHLAQAHETYLKILRHAMGRSPVSAEHRSAHENLLLAIRAAHDLRREREQALATISRPQGEGWKLAPELLREVSGGYELGFVKAGADGHYAVDDPGLVHWVKTDKTVFKTWHDQTRSYLNQVQEGIKRVGGTANEFARYMFSASDEAGAVHTLNAAFLLQTLLGPERTMLMGTEDEALRAMTGVDSAQLDAAQRDALLERLRDIRVQTRYNAVVQTFGLLQEGSELARIVSELSASAPAWASGVTRAGALTGGLGLGFDVGNVVFAGIDLAHAKTENERAEAGVRLSTSIAALGMDSSALIAGFSGYATVAGVLGALGVPFLGVSMGAIAVVRAYDERAKKVDASMGELERMGHQLDRAPLQFEQEYCALVDDIVVSQVDFAQGRVTYGGVRVQAKRGGNWIATPNADPDHWLDLYEGWLGQNTTKPFASDGLQKLAHDPVFVLPTARARDYVYDLVDSPGFNMDNFPHLTALEEHFGDKFVAKHTYFFSVYHLSNLEATYRDTPISVMLDQHPRTIAVPNVEDEHVRSQLQYTLQGHAGRYTVVMGAWAYSTLTLAGSGVADEGWFLDMSQPLSTMSVDPKTGNLVRGELQPGVLNTLNWRDDKLQVGGQTWVNFSHVASNQARAYVALDERGTTSLILSRQPEGIVYTLQMQDLGVSSLGLEGLMPAEIMRLGARLAHAGMTQTYMPVFSGEGGSGIVNLTTGESLFAVGAEGTFGMYVDGVHTQTIAAVGLPDISLAATPQQSLLRVTVRLDEDCTLTYDYQKKAFDNYCVHLTAHRLNRLFSDGGERDALMAHFLHTTGMQTLSFTDDQGVSAQARVDGERGLTMTSFLHIHDAHRVLIDCVSQRLTYASDVLVRLAAEDLTQYEALLLSIRTLEITGGNDFTGRATIILDPDAAVFKNKLITLVPQGALDLKITRGRLSWRWAGDDLLLFVNDNPPIKWLNGKLALGSGNTFQLGDQTALDLGEALAAYPPGEPGALLPVVDYSAADNAYALTLHTHSTNGDSIAGLQNVVGLKQYGAMQIWKEAGARFVDLRSDNGEIEGVLDLQTHHSLLRYAHADKTELWMDGTLAGSMAPDALMQVQVDRRGLDPALTVVWKTDYGEATVNDAYVGGEIVATTIGASTQLLYDVMKRGAAGMPRVLTEALLATPPRKALKFVNEYGMTAHATLAGPERKLEVTRFTFNTDERHLNIDRTTQTTTVHNFTTTLSLDPQLYPTFQQGITRLHIENHMPAGIRTSIDMSFMGDEFKGMEITISSAGPIDLNVGRTMSHERQGGDLVLHPPGQPIIRLLDVFGTHGSASTVRMGPHDVFAVTELDHVYAGDPPQHLLSAGNLLGQTAWREHAHQLASAMSAFSQPGGLMPRDHVNTAATAYVPLAVLH